LFDPEFDRVFGDAIEPNRLSNEMAAGFARLLRSGDYEFARLVQAFRASNGTETVKFEVDVERPQRPAAPIACRETIAAIFRDDLRPVVYALRQDFPTEALHLNLGAPGEPPCLCLDERPWTEAKPRWTPFTLVERVRWWLAATARGDLHGEAQPAEPVFFAACSLIVPADLFNGNWAEGRSLNIHAAYSEADPHTIVMRDGSPGDTSSANRFVPLFIKARPQIMQRLRCAPRNVKELHTVLKEWGVDLIETLRSDLRQIQANNPGQLVARPLILLFMPLLNVDGSPTGQVDLKAFSTLAEFTLAKLGVELGIFHPASGITGGGGVVTRIPPDLSMEADEVPTVILSVHANFGRDVAAAASGLQPDNRSAVLIGAGAIGSHVVEIMRRDGFGEWTLIDNDSFLPHNVQRHRGVEALVGAPKARVTADLVNRVVGSANETKSIISDILRGNAECKDALTRAKLVVDASASIPVARYLSDQSEFPAPRASVFFNPAGVDVVLIGEDSARTVKLDALEAQYYRAVLDVPELLNHMSIEGSRYQFAGACRAVSTRMPEHRVSMLSGAIAGELRRHLSAATPSIVIWSGSGGDGLRRAEIRALPIRLHDFAGWEVVIDEGILANARELRRESLPSETGGILLGTIDIPRRQICVVKLVPAPADSLGDSAGFERGVRNLSTIVADAKKRTAGQVEYVGEWHSHPAGVEPSASGTDVRQLIWLGAERNVEGLPTLMMIVGDGDEYSVNMVITQ
jgi:hypothetical protein